MEENEIIFADKFYRNISLELFYRYSLNWYPVYQIAVWIILTSVKVIFIFPLVIIGLLYTLGLCLKAYRYYLKCKGHTFTPKCWISPGTLVSHIWAIQGRFWHGYEVKGMENIPYEGGAVIVLYHGVIPVDGYYLLANIILHKKRLPRTVADRFLFNLPGFDAYLDCFRVFPGNFDTCVDILKKGHLLGIFPGGVREALFSDRSYSLIWGTRKGFAKVAIEAKVPIIPVFTENIREAFRPVSFGKSLLRWLYEKIRVPVILVYGGFPVKLTTHIGEPVPYDPEVSADELAAKIAVKMEALIKKHQRIPGSILHGILQRIRHLFKFKNC